MTSKLDTAIASAMSAEATYLADTAAVANIQTAIDTATSPLAGAKATVTADIATFNAALDAVSAAALAAKIPV